ncbi:MAG: hypothetical protein WKG00_40120 [Polyangiaceae bacterium]
MNRGALALCRAGLLGAGRAHAGPLAVSAIDGQGRGVDLAREHASLQRTAPERLADDAFGATRDPDALRFVVQGAPADLPATLSIRSLKASGAPLDALADVALGSVPCPAGAPAGAACGSTAPIRAVIDEVDRDHPLVRARSILAELGGALLVARSPDAQPLVTVRVAGPRRSALGAIERYRARLRVVLVRGTAGGAPPMGGTQAGAVEVARAEVGRANGLWGACGISFGPPAEADIRVVDPPAPHLLALGCDHGLPAAGGTVRVRVDGKEVSARIAAGTTPAGAARRVAAAIGAAGFVARVSDNPTIARRRRRSDVLVRRRGGALAFVDAPANGPVSDDATLTACIGSVDLEDGLQHFGDVDAISGTIEERTLIKAFDDNDPATIEVVLIPSFAGGGRIGESFISADVGAVRNAVIEDRAGVRADRASFALAHELGHVLLDEPGHPDDFGVDTPTRLMDADAANPSAYGPRRLLVEECVRAIRQSGPGAPVRVLEPWPLQEASGSDPGSRPEVEPQPRAPSRWSSALADRRATPSNTAETRSLNPEARSLVRPLKPEARSLLMC